MAPQAVSPSSLLSNHGRLLIMNCNYKLLLLGLIVVIYFTWMDIALYINLQRWSPPPIVTSSSSSQQQATTADIEFFNSNQQQQLQQQQQLINGSLVRPVVPPPAPPPVHHNDPFTVFKPLSVKLIMVDHVTHYFHDIVARFIEDTLHFTYHFPWITANTVSFAGLGLACVGSYMITSESLVIRQMGSIVYEMRNLADSLDGVVFRSRVRRDMLEAKTTSSSGSLDLNDDSNAAKRQNNNGQKEIVYQSVYGTLGYNVDVICDGLGGLVLMIAILYRFLRHPPRKNQTPHLLLTQCIANNVSPRSAAAGSLHSNSNYSYHQLIAKYECDDDNDDYDDELNRRSASSRNINDVEKGLVRNSLKNSSFGPSSSSSSSQMGLLTIGTEVKTHSRSHSLGVGGADQTILNNRQSHNNSHHHYNPSASLNNDHGLSRAEHTTSSSSIMGHVTTRQVKIVVVSFGFRLLATALLWDYFVHKYHDLVMNYSNNPSQRRLQAQAFKSIGMWLIMWFWRLGNSCALLSHLTISNFFDKLWDYISFTSYIGWVYLVLLTLFSQIHYAEWFEDLNGPLASSI